MHGRRDRSDVLVPLGRDEEGPQSFADSSPLGLGGTSNGVGPNGRAEQGDEATDGQLRRKLSNIAPVVQDVEEGSIQRRLRKARREAQSGRIEQLLRQVY